MKCKQNIGLLFIRRPYHSYVCIINTLIKILEGPFKIHYHEPCMQYVFKKAVIENINGFLKISILSYGQPKVGTKLEFATLKSSVY